MKENQENQSLITQNIQEQEPQKKSWFSRTFGPLKDGSLRGVIFALLASAMGTGIFNLPLRVEYSGVIAFFLFVSLACIFSSIGNLLITRLISQNNFKTYSQMAQKAGGNILMRISNICLIVYPWGITICFQVILAKFIVQLLNDVFGLNLYDDRQNQYYNTSGNLARITTNLVVILLALPLVFKKNIGVIQKLGLVGVFSVIFNVIAIIITTFTGFTRIIDGKQVVYHGIFNLHRGQVNWFTTGGFQILSLHAQDFASVLFCFVNHQLLFPLCNSLARPSQRRFNKINLRIHVTQYISYFFLAITAYLLLVQHTDKYPISPMVIASIPNILITIGKFAMCFALFFAVPINLFPARQYIFQTFEIQRTKLIYIVISLILCISSCGIAIAFQQVNSYFGLLGGTAGVSMAGAIPAFCYIRLKANLKRSEIVLLVLVALTTLISFIGAILSVVIPV